MILKWVDLETNKNKTLSTPVLENNTGNQIVYPFAITDHDIDSCTKLSIKINQDWCKTLEKGSIIRFMLHNNKVILIKDQFNFELKQTIPLRLRTSLYGWSPKNDIQVVDINKIIYIYENFVANLDEFNDLKTMPLSIDLLNKIEKFVITNLESCGGLKNNPNAKKNIKTIFNIKNRMLSLPNCPEKDVCWQKYIVKVESLLKETIRNQNEQSDNTDKTDNWTAERGFYYSPRYGGL